MKKTEPYRITKTDENGNVETKYTIGWVDDDGYYRTNRRYTVNSQLAEKLGYNISILKEVSQKVLFEKYNNCLVKPGQNYRLLVEKQADYQVRMQAKEAQKIKEGASIINFTYQNLLGLGFQISEQLHKDVWQIAKPFATYQKNSDSFQECVDDMTWGVDARDLTGWYYEIGAIEAFIRKGYKVSFYDNELDPKSPVQVQVDSIKKRMQRDRVQKEAASRRAEKHKATLKDKIIRTFEDSGYPSIEELQESGATGLDYIKAPELGYDGPTIYGSGKWFMLDQKYFYLVRNNGGDGDDWSRNNLSTGGAGAICFRVQRNEKVDSIIEEITQFDDTFASHFEQQTLPVEEYVQNKMEEDYPELEGVQILNWRPKTNNITWIELKTGLQIGYNGQAGRMFIHCKLEFSSHKTKLEREAQNFWSPGGISKTIEIQQTKSLLDEWQANIPDWSKSHILGRFRISLRTTNSSIKTLELTSRQPLNKITYAPGVKAILKRGDYVHWDDGIVTKGFKDSGEYPIAEPKNEFQKKVLSWNFGEIGLSEILSWKEEHFSERLITETKNNHSYIGLSQLNVAGEIYYKVEWAWWGYDDADDGISIFKDKTKAEEFYKEKMIE